MKFVFLGNFTSGWDGSICDELHIAEALRDEGHEVLQIQRENLNIPHDNYDYALIAQWNGYPNDIVQKLKDVGAKQIIYWAFDYQWLTKEKWHMDLAVNADYFFSKEIEHQTELSVATTRLCSRVPA